MKSACFFLLIFGLFCIQQIEGQEFCHDLSVGFNISGDYCGEAGNIALYYNVSNYQIQASLFNVTIYNFNPEDLCIDIVSLDFLGSDFNCGIYNVPYDYGQIFINFSLCSNQNEDFGSIGPIYYNNSAGLSANWTIGSCSDDSFACYSFPTLKSLSTISSSTLNLSAPSALTPFYNGSSTPSGSTVSPSNRFRSRITEGLHPNRFSVDQFCAATPSPTAASTPVATAVTMVSPFPTTILTEATTTANISNTTAMTSPISNYPTTTLSPTVFTSVPTTVSTSTLPVPINSTSITPPTPSFNCSDPDNSYLIDQTCAINGTNNSTYIAQVINETTTTIHEIIANNSFTSDDVHDTGIFLYHTVTKVDTLSTDSAHKFLDVTSTVVVQPLNKLADANKITPNSLLWYPSSIPKVVAKTDQNLNYTKDGANLLLHSFNLDFSFCADSENSREICYSKNSQVPSGDKDAEFCTTFNPKSLCNKTSTTKAYLTMWKSLSFFALVKNNNLGIKTGLESEQPSSTPYQPVTFDTAHKCSDGTYLKNNYGSNVGGVNSDGDSIATSSSIWIKRRDDENDLHIKSYRIAKFTSNSFEDAGTPVTKSNEHYTAECPDGTCTLIADGNPTEPTLCNTNVKTTQTVLIGVGVLLTVVGICAIIFQSDYFSVVSRVIQIFFSVFNDKNLPLRVKFFAYCYNITFMLYSIYLIFISQQDDISDKMCTIYAIIGYVLYISAIFLSITMIIITLDALGCWKPMLKNIFLFFTGNQKIYFPFIYSYGIPFLITGGFAAALNSFFKRNDGYCWIRPDYAFPALWIPCILLLCTIPLYIILIARRWPDVGFFKIIYGPLTIPEEITLFEELRRKKEYKEKEEDIEDFRKKILGKDYKPNGDANNDAETAKEEEDDKVILTSRTIARLMIPQLFLAIPLIAENLALYYSEITGWHYLFLLTQGLQLIVLNAIDWLDELPEKIDNIKDSLNSLRGGSKDEISDELRWGTEPAQTKTNNGTQTQFTRM